MAFLKPGGDFERQINRGIRSHRSSRLDAVVAAIDAFTKARSGALLQAITVKFELWKERDPKEFADRGRALEAQLRHEIRTEGRDLKVTIPILDPSAHPDYNPAIWNDATYGWGRNADGKIEYGVTKLGRVQHSANCYAYACNDPGGHPLLSKPQPGEISGMPIDSLDKVKPATVRWHVMKDDLSRGHQQKARLVPLIRLRDEPVPDYVVNVPGHYLVALLTAPFRDYHWVRQDSNGMWSHKPGWGKVTDRDSMQQPIHDPRDAIIWPDDSMRSATYQFTTFYYVPKGGVRTGDLGGLDQDQARELWTNPRDWVWMP